jgi:DNA-binding response OmpR family regulator
MKRDPFVKSTIFYVDDDKDDLEFFEEAVNDLNETVYVFEQGDKMLHVLNHPPPTPSIIFLDLNMPGKSGFDLLTEIQQSHTFSTIPVIILTTSGHPDDIAKSKTLGARLYIRKPPSITALRKAITYTIHINWDTFQPSAQEFLYSERSTQQ